jgi:glycosyltransferase involved in cell wall biosynthesis
MKILHLIEPMIGGTYTYISTLLKYNDERDHITIIYSNHRCGRSFEYYTEVFNNNVQLICEKMKNKIDIISDIKIGLRVKKVVKENKFDVIVLHSTKAGLIGRVFLFKYRDKIIYYPHGMIYSHSQSTFSSLFLKYLEKGLGLFTRKIVCTSRSEKQKYIDDNIITYNKLSIISHGIKNCNRKKNKKANKITTVLNVSRVVDVKKPFDFITIAERVLLEENNLKFIWVGDGPLLKDCLSRCKSKGLEEKIKFIGYCSNPQNFYLKSDILLSTSIYESFGLSIAEAMTFDNLIIARDCTGVNDLVVKDVTGYKFNTIAEAVQLLLKNKLVTGDSLRIKSQAQSMIKNMYSLEKMFLQTRELYQSILL